MEERKHELVVSLSAGALHLQADPLRVEQILVNLLTNAATYTNAGGRICLTASAEIRVNPPVIFVVVNVEVARRVQEVRFIDHGLRVDGGFLRCMPEAVQPVIAD